MTRAVCPSRAFNGRTFLLHRLDPWSRRAKFSAVSVEMTIEGVRKDAAGRGKSSESKTTPIRPKGPLRSASLARYAWWTWERNNTSVFSGATGAAHGARSGAHHLPRMEAMLGAVDGPLIDALCLDASYRIADIGAGGGGTALAIFQRAPAGSVVHGFDLSPALVEAAQGRVPHDEPSDLFPGRGRGERSERPSRPTSEWSRVSASCSSMSRGPPSLAFSTGSRRAGGSRSRPGPIPSKTPGSTIVRDAVAEVVTIPSTDPDGPGPFRYCRRGEARHPARRSGFAELEVQDFRTGAPDGRRPPCRRGRGVRADVLLGVRRATICCRVMPRARRVREALIASFSRHQKDGVVLLDACVHLFTGASEAELGRARVTDAPGDEREREDKNQRGAAPLVEDTPR